MDRYPKDSIEHNICFLVVSGIAKGASVDTDGKGILVRSELPSLETREAEVLRRYFEKIDASKLPWNGHDTSRKHRFHCKIVDRVWRMATQ